uniref:Uncharacterized protein n=1 Tax=Panagrolaimus davidi TaxID=227884 RepID=A0A914Q148_9BILA
MFKKEAIENKMVIQDFPFEIVDIAVKLIYDKRISLKNPLEDMLLLYEFGQKYCIKFIMDLIEKYLIKEISPATVVYLYKFSSPDAANIVKLQQKCIDHFMKCLKEKTPIYAAESLGETFLASIVLKSLHSNFTDTNTTGVYDLRAGTKINRAMTVVYRLLEHRRRNLVENYHSNNIFDFLESMAGLLALQ